MDEKDFEEAGLYDPRSPKASERLELLRWCIEQGVTLSQMKEANARGQLEFVVSSHRLRPGPFLTQRQLAERLGQPTEVIEAFRLAFALPPLRPDEPWCNESEAEMFASVASGVELFGFAGMERLSRVLGSSVSRVAEAMASTNSERLRLMRDAGATEAEIAKANLNAIETSSAPGKIIMGLLSIHLQLAAARLRERRNKEAEETILACIGFVDLSGSTTISRALSPKELAETVDHFEEVAHRIAVNGRGRVVKFIGDEVMFVTGDADSACNIALSLIEAFADDPSIVPRGGLAYGPMLDRAGDYYGPIVNLAARLGEIAVPREVLVTPEIAARIRSNAFECEPAGKRRLRGFDDPVSLLTVSRKSPQG